MSAPSSAGLKLVLSLSQTYLGYRGCESIAARDEEGSELIDWTSVEPSLLFSPCRCQFQALTSIAISCAIVKAGSFTNGLETYVNTLISSSAVPYFNATNTSIILLPSAVSSDEVIVLVPSAILLVSFGQGERKEDDSDRIWSVQVQRV
jgi:hypothetical protein